MASKLGEVLDIEATDSYIKRLAGPMVTIEVKNIVKFAGYIRIPSMAEGTAFIDTISQKILYSCLPNQCRKCRRFGHQARACNVVRNFAQIRAAHRAPVPNETDNKYPSTRPTSTITARVRAQNSRAVPRHDEQVLGTYQGSAPSNLPGSQTSAPPPSKDPSKN